MFRSALMATALLVVAVPAVAGGFAPVVTTPPPATPVVVAPPVAPSADWSGFYVGGQLGFGRTDMDISSTIGEGSAGFGEGSGALFGVHAGYMYDFGRVVAGAELDWDQAQIDLEGVEFAEEAGELGSIDSIARAKLRLGYDAGRFLPYVTAGLARASFDFSDPEADAALSDTGNGHFFGIGAVYAVNDRFTIGIEALRHDFGDSPEVRVAEPFEFDTEVTTISLRGSYRF